MLQGARLLNALWEILCIVEEYFSAGLKADAQGSMSPLPHVDSWLLGKSLNISYLSPHLLITANDTMYVSRDGDKIK